MNSRALLIALAVGLIGFVLMILYVRRFENEASGGEKIKVLVVTKAVERGNPLTDEVLATRDIPQAYIEDRAVRAVDRPKIIGLRVGTDLQAQQTLMWTDIASASEGRRDLSSLVQPGSRAVTVRTSRDDPGNKMIRPGDYVDVIAVLPSSGGSERTSTVLLQRVLVLAAGLETSIDTDSKTRNSDKDSLLTLSLTLAESQLIALALEKGNLSVALRNPEDQRVVERVPDVKTLTEAAQRYAPAPVRRQQGPTPIPPDKGVQ